MSIEIPNAAIEAAAMMLEVGDTDWGNTTEYWRDAARGSAQAVIESALPHLIPAITADYNKKLLAWAQDVDPSGRTREILHHFAALAGTEGDDEVH